MDNQLARIDLVKERLEFVELIGSLNQQFLKPELAMETKDGGWTHPWKHFDSLRTYLLLTCFDLLGQPDEFMDFGAWLRAGRTREERDSILLSIPDVGDFVQRVSMMHEAYLGIYGVKKSFLRFIDDVIPEASKASLLYSIRVSEFDPTENREIGILDEETRKTGFLYWVRNSYTHKAISTGSPAGGVFSNWGMPILIDGVPKMGWEPICTRIDGGKHYSYGVRNWPTVLIEVVTCGLREIERLSAAT